MTRAWVRLMVAGAFVSVAASTAWAQGAAPASMTGAVADASGSPIPGATVRAKQNATGATAVAFTNFQGAFTFATLADGPYTVTVSRSGFKSAVVSDVQVAAGQAAFVKATLEASPIVPPETGIPVSFTASDLDRLPLTSRNLVHVVTFLPGVNTPDIDRRATINGVSGSLLTITVDGVNNNDNFNKSTEGLFAMTTPRQDAVAGVSVTTAAPPADGTGGARIAFQTRSGSDRFIGSLYQALRGPGLNSIDWFSQDADQPKNEMRLNQIGGRQGGPVVLPGVFDGRGKAFFFFNYEEQRLSDTVSRTRTMLTPQAQAGVFRYAVTVGGAVQVREVNLFALPGVGGVGAALDPTVAKVLNDIRAAAALAQAGGQAVNGRVSQGADPNLQAYLWQSPGHDVERQPVVRFDYNLSSKHRLNATYTWQSVSQDPNHLAGGDARFPGLPNSSLYRSRRPLVGATLRSSITSNIVNEFSAGAQWGATDLGSDASNGRSTFDGSGGYALTLALGLTDWHAENTVTSRSAGSWNLTDTVSWQKSRHGLTMGGALHVGRVSLTTQQIAQAVGFGVDAGDPAIALFSATNFPGASADQRAAAAALFGMLTGRVNSLGGPATLNEDTNAYAFLGPTTVAGRQTEYALFAQDSWRVTSTLTVTGGLRWTVQMPFTSDSNSLSTATMASVCGISGIGAGGLCRFYQPGLGDGEAPTFSQLGPGARAWAIDWNNFAPSASAAWRPDVETGWLRRLFGDPEQATFSGGYAEAFAREGMGLYVNHLGRNPGGQISAARSAALGNLIPVGETYPLLLGQASRLGPAAFPPTAVYPIAARANRADDIQVFADDIQVARARSYTASFRRSISANTSAEFRWVQTRGLSQWVEEDYNERDIFGNNFYGEFRLAMVNLEKNLAAGRGATFAYAGPGTGTSPLPTYLAYLNGLPVAQAGNPAVYAGAGWTNLTFLNRLAVQSPNPFGAAADLDGDLTLRANALAAGLPANFFVINPDVGRVGVYDSRGFSRHDALQFVVRRRLSRGLQVDGSYQYAWASASTFVSPRFGHASNPVGTVRHAIKAQWHWTVFRGWAVSGVARIQARTIDFGNVRLVGMTLDQLAKEYRYRIADDPLNPGRQIVTMLPDDIILNTQRAFAVDATSATGYSALGVPQGRYFAPPSSATCIQFRPGECAPATNLVQAPWFSRIDIGVAKTFQGRGRVNIELRLDVFNLFNAVNFTPVATPGSGATAFRVTSAYQDLNTFDPGGRVGQFVWRIKW